MKTAKLSILAIALALMLVCTAHAGVTKIQVRPFVGLFGGGNALDGISGYTIHPDDYAMGHDGTGVTWYFMFPVDSGSTTESTTTPPYIVCPDDQQAGGGTAGTTTWAQAAISGNTVHGKVFVVDTRTVKGGDVDAWNVIQSNVTDFVRGLFASYLAAGAVSATSMYALPATMAQLSAYLAANAVSGNSLAQAYALQAMVTAALNAASFTGTTAFALQTVVDAVMAQLTAATNAGAVSATSLWATPLVTDGSGTTLYIIDASATGTSKFTGANLSANQVACAIAVSFGSAISGDSVFVVTPWDFVVTGVSLISVSGVVETAGASIFQHDVPTASYNISGSGATTYSVSGTGRITAGTPLLFKMGTVTTGRTWLVELIGRKE